MKSRQFCVNTPQHGNLQILATEMFRVHTAANDILNEVFPLKPPSNYNLRNQQEFTVNH